MEIQLAEKLGVSRTPIREAIRKLELEGLVLMIPRKGAEVARISEKSMRDVLEVRRSLEELAIELACERMTEEDFKELDLAQNAFKKGSGRGNCHGDRGDRRGYHDIIYNSTGNTRLVQILNNLREQMYRYRLEYMQGTKKNARFSWRSTERSTGLSAPAMWRRPNRPCGNTLTIRKSPY